MINREKPSSTLLRKRLKNISDPRRAKKSPRFFKTGKGDYGEGDIFIGVSVPAARALAVEFISLPLSEIEKNLKSPIHEERLVGILILVERFKRSPEERKNIFDFYLDRLDSVDNWDLIDLSADKIIGEWLIGKRNRKIVYALSRSENVWRRRAAMVSTFAFIKRGELDDAFKIALVLLGDDHDLIKKAVGWMLREAGKVDVARLEKFILNNLSRLSRTTLRYAIERFPESKRKKILSL